MKLMALAHQRALRYPACRVTLDLDALHVADPDNTTVLTFARCAVPVRRLSALDRLGGLPPGDVVVSRFETSPLSALLLWDIAHGLPVGRRLYLQASDNVANLLERAYYREAFREVTDIPDVACGLRVFTKDTALPAEADRGLEQWSFCIPTGDGEPSALNACVARILALGVPQMEIVLCGRPRADFRYWDHVRIVGEDIPAPPVHITRKKNVLATAARYPNLCILHDRVLLPVNFMSAVRRFGDDYPFTGFQSFWFADTWNAVPRRYSDVCVGQQVPSVLTAAVRTGREVLPAYEQMGFVFQHPCRADFGREHLTGSLYLCKKQVWARWPQNEQLNWSEYEDVEHGLWASVAGIPSRINPYSLTRTLSYRSIFHFLGASIGSDIRGQVKPHRLPQEWWGLPRHPTLRITESEGRQRLAVFARQYSCTDMDVPSGDVPMTGLRRYALIARLLWAAQGDTRNLVRDWYHSVLCEEPVPSDVDWLQAVLDSAESPARKKLDWLRHPALIRQVYNNPFSSPFLPDTLMAVSPPGWRLKAGSLLAALTLKYVSRDAAFPLSLRELWLVILNSGPRHQEGEDE
ncbi:hypothetical protein FH968_00155 [Buttiauxella sp. B2]|uniref:hypothetical protein n=1 Tax=Buttiauxella sp. B2 TaxID=2587812 RepID=UPI00111EB285|nr:hypothetical protein [Buttiauxella sp. B2]TNV22512.1 hypothetical protein FH968_00155 [Buttiauxella sp. B2]